MLTLAATLVAVITDAFSSDGVASIFGLRGVRSLLPLAVVVVVVVERDEVGTLAEALQIEVLGVWSGVVGIEWGFGL
jgi:hypothetical protein